MLCKLHSVYNTLHTLCDITQKVSNHYTVEGQFFAFNLEKNYTGQKNFTQTPSVASVTNIGYASHICLPQSTEATYCSFSQGKVKVDSIDDAEELEFTDVAFDTLGFSLEEKQNAFKLTASIAHLGEMT